ncbi:MAG: FAD-dependent oxidoreductase [Lagierella massiliensis]|nr:FAD-dependent oxidoreductase [Lagierella massiliensis]
MKIVVIGGVAGGATAIARLRRLDENAEIILLERGEYVSFANCGLPYYVGGTIENRDSLFVTTDKDISKKYNVDVRVKNEVIKINPESKSLLIRDYNKGEDYELSYDKLLMSTGSKPLVPNVKGIENDNVFTLWNIPDVDRITDYVKQNKPKKAVIVGAGFIGLEMAENLHDLGMDVSVVEKANQVMPPIDYDMAKLVENHMANKGVHLYLDEEFKSIDNDGKTLVLKSNKRIDTDIIIMSIGVRPNSELAKEAGLSLTKSGHIEVNENMQTSNEDIYAIGDVIAVRDYITNEVTAVPLAGPANKQGREVAQNILNIGDKKVYRGTMGTSVAKVFDLTVASVGLNEKTLKNNNKIYKKDYFVSIIHPMSHAGYYPGATPLTLKLIYGNDGIVLGGQIVGYEGVDKRIDTIATTIHFHGTVNDLSELELAYAPPYSSAKDPVNFAGYTARNVLDGLSDPVLFEEYKENKEKYTLLDIRENPEVASGKLEGAVHIPLTELRNRVNELDKDKNYIAYCAVGLRGYIAERILKHHGIKASNLVGGYRTAMDLSDNANNLDKSFSMTSTEQDKFQEKSNETSDAKEVKVLNVCGMSCPGPIVQVSKAMENLKNGEVLKVTATDPGFVRDISSWTENTGNKLLNREESKGTFIALIKKGQGEESDKIGNLNKSSASSKEKTMIIFDGDLDRAIASFIIATGAAAMGNKVHMFFTFWGLSILRKEQSPKVEKDFMGKMFSSMLPKGSKKLSLSRMNFMGMGSKMIRSVMKKKGVDSLEDLIQQALDAGVELTACQMTMDIMGLTQEELIDGVNVGGVATMLADNDKSNMNLFI